MREENEKIKNIYSVRELAFSSNGECILFLLEVSNNNLVKKNKNNEQKKSEGEGAFVFTYNSLVCVTISVFSHTLISSTFEEFELHLYIHIEYQ